MTVKHKAIKFNINAVTAALDPDSEPLIYGTPESPASIEGEVVLECDYECKGTVFVLTYAAVVDVTVNTVQDYHTDSTYFDKKEFQYELMHPPGRPNHLTPNIYRFPFAFDVSPKYPSSFNSNGARMRYLLEGRLIRKRSRDFKKTVVVHVHNTAITRELISTSFDIPARSGSTLEFTATDAHMERNEAHKDPNEPGKGAISPALLSPSETTLVPAAAIFSAAALNPTLQRFSNMWAGRLPYEVILPTLTLLWGQITPITVRIYRPSDGTVLSSESNAPQSCPLDVQKVVQIKATLEQETIIHAGVAVCTSHHTALQATWDGPSSKGWPDLTDLVKPLPSQDDGVQAHSPFFWQQVLLFQVPLKNAMKILPPTIDCKCLKIDYVLKVTVDLMPAPGKKQEAMESKSFAMGARSDTFRK
ncbi:hypothetical protein BGZ68_000836 [Mortierella alpina]|nr:hypothetical protein BGZ68_000836 [Mortierella alpina]